METIKIDNNKLTAAVALIKTINPARSAKPVLQNARVVSQKKGDLRLIATNLESYLTFNIGGDQLSPGEYDQLVDFDRLEKVIKSFGKKGSCKVRSNRIPASKTDPEKNFLTFSCGDLTHDVTTESAEDYPGFILDPLTREETASAILPVAELSKAIAKVAPAMARDKAQYSLAGLLFDFQGGNVGKLSVVGCDTHRLAAYNFDNPIPRKDQRAILPGSVVKTLIKALSIVRGDPCETVLVAINTDNAKRETLNFKHPLFEINARPIEGNYPLYKNVFPKDLNKSFILDRAEAIKAIKALGNFTNKKTRALGLKASGISIALSAENYGEKSGTNIGAVIPSGDLSLSIDYKYFQDMLEAIGGDKVEIFGKDKDSPLLYSDGELNYVCSPVCPH